MAPLLRYAEANPLTIGEANDAKPKLARAKASRWFLRAGDHAYVTGDGVGDAESEGWIELLAKGTEPARVVDPGSPPVQIPEPTDDEEPAEVAVAEVAAEDEGEVIPDDLLDYFTDDGELIEPLSGNAKDVIAEIGDDPLKARAVRLAGDDRKTVVRHIDQVLDT